MRVLFVCNFNQHRSPTAARVLSHKYETRSAGLYSGDKLTAEHIDWADRIVVFTSPMISEVIARFPSAEQKPILNFDISPYHYDDDDLEEVLLRKAETMLGTP